MRELARTWERGIEHLPSFVAAHGHCRVPARYACADGFLLGRFVCDARRRRTLGGLRPARIAALDALGFVWQPRHARLNAAIAEVRVASRRRGYPATLSAATLRLLRDARHEGHLTDLEIADLSALLFPWRAAGYAFERGMAATTAYFEANGRLPTYSALHEGCRVGNFWHHQKVALRAGRLSPEREGAVVNLLCGSVAPPART
ncbi:MAG TPA: helicase associated domain-containing protein [Candidatus Limnocylindrales bacterium]|jgi:hypothetical protein